MWSTTTIPINYLLCDGSSFSGVTYPVLEMVLGGTTLPDLRGQFIRGYDSSGSVDPDGTGRVLGDTQIDTIASHTHTGTTNVGGGGSAPISGTTNPASIDLLVDPSTTSYFNEGTLEYSELTGDTKTRSYSHSHTFSGTVTIPSHTHTFTSNATGSLETRPKNVCLHFIIRCQWIYNLVKSTINVII